MNAFVWSIFFDRNDKYNSQEITLEKPSKFRNKFTGILSIMLGFCGWKIKIHVHVHMEQLQKSKIKRKKSSYYVEAVIISHVKLKGAVNVFFHIKFLDP